MANSLALHRDMIVLAHLHAALDSVVTTAEALREIGSGAKAADPTVRRLADLMNEAHVLLRSLLTRPTP